MFELFDTNSLLCTLCERKNLKLFCERFKTLSCECTYEDGYKLQNDTLFLFQIFT